MKAIAKGCTTCRARKVRCDRNRPFCTRCLHTGRICGGYHDVVHLSWPKGSNHRRAITVTAPLLAVRRPREFTFVESTIWDVELYYHLTQGRNVTECTRHAITSFLDAPVRWMPHKLDHTDNQLMLYFESTAFLSLTTLSTEPLALRNTLFRMALSSNSAASAAVLYLIMALASLHCQEPRSRALQHKIAALRKLSESISHGTEGIEAFQHSAAGIMLCTFEVQQRADIPKHWIWYVCGSRNIIKRAVRDRPLSRDSDSGVVLDWLHYYDVLARFSARHWRDLYISDDDYMGRNVLQKPSYIPYPTTPSHQVLQLMAEAVESMVSPSDPKYHTDEYWRSVEQLNWRLNQVPVTAEDPASSISESEAKTLTISNLYQLAGLIYLEHASKDRPGQSGKVRQWLNDAFNILQSLQTCPWSLPLLIFGYEAQSDEQRLIMLDLISRTEKRTYMGNLGCLKMLLRTLWVQDDLATSNLGYIDRLSRIMSIGNNPPTLHE